MPRLSERQLALLLTFPLLFLQFAICIYPIIYSLWLSFTNTSLLSTTIEFVGFSQYAKIFKDVFMRQTSLVTARFVAESTLLIVGSALLMALILNQPIRGRSILKVIVILPWALSEFAVAIAGRFFLDRNYGFLNVLLIKLGLIKEGIYFLDAPFAVEWLSLFFAWNVAPLGAYFILSALQTIPMDLYKQARVDGASAFTRFRVVTLPFIRYALLMTMLLATILSATSIVLAFGLTGGGPGLASTPITLYDFRVFFYNGDYGYGAAISWLLLIIAMILATAYFIALTRRRRG